VLLLQRVASKDLFQATSARSPKSKDLHIVAVFVRLSSWEQVSVFWFRCFLLQSLVIVSSFEKTFCFYHRHRLYFLDKSDPHE